MSKMIKKIGIVLTVLMICSLAFSGLAYAKAEVKVDLVGGTITPTSTPNKYHVHITIDYWVEGLTPYEEASSYNVIFNGQSVGDKKVFDFDINSPNFTYSVSVKATITTTLLDVVKSRGKSFSGPVKIDEVVSISFPRVYAPAIYTATITASGSATASWEAGSTPSASGSAYIGGESFSAGGKATEPVEEGDSRTVSKSISPPTFYINPPWPFRIFYGLNVTCNDATISGSASGTVVAKAKVEPRTIKGSTTILGDACGSPSVKVGSKVNLATGNLFEDAPITTNLTLCYNSLDDYTGSLGRGWTHNYNINISSYRGRLLEMDEEGARKVFTEEPDGTYSPVPILGYHAVIVKNPDGSYLLTRKYGTKYSFNADGKLTKIEDRNSNIQTFTYADSNLTKITDSSGRVTTLTYNVANCITEIIDPASSTTQFIYDGDGNLTQIIDPLGNSRKYTYNSENKLISKQDQQSNTYHYTYDEEGRLLTVTDPDNNETIIQYNPDDSQATVTDSLNNETLYTYNRILNVLTEIKDPLENTIVKAWDINRNPVMTTDANGNATANVYDVSGNLLNTTDPEGNQTAYTYEPVHNQTTSVTNSQENKTLYGYDEKGNLTSTTDSNNQTTGYGYDEKGNFTSITNNENQTTSFEYDEYDNLSMIVDNLGNTTNFTYDVSGNMTQRSDSQGNITKFEYNELNQLIRITDPKGNITTFTYDVNGNKTSSTDALNNTTQYEYNSKNQLINVTDSRGGTTLYGYDSIGNRTSIIDANGNETILSYDSLNHLISETDQEGNTILYSYDVKGNLISRTDANGVTTSYAYDTLNRLTQTLYPENLAINYSYNSLGNLTHLVDGVNNIEVNYTYDKLSQLIKLNIPSQGSISYEYNSLGNRIKMIDPDGKITTYSYDELNRLISLTNPDSQSTSYEYNKLDRRTKMSYPNNTYATYSYDENGRLTNLTNYGRRNRIISSYNYTYDALGNRLTKKEKKETTNYEYDSLYQLTKAISSRGWDVEYSYDPVGNRTNLTTSFISPFLKDYYDYKIKLPKKIHRIAEINYSYNSANELIKEEQLIGRKNIPIKTINYEYDNNGNRVLKDLTMGRKQRKISKKFLTSYAYDPENRLTSITYATPHIFRKGTKANCFAYCPFGKRIYKSDSTGDTYFFYDRDNILLELDSQNKTIARYTTGLGIDEWISRSTYRKTKVSYGRKHKRYKYITKTKTIYYHYDGLGSVVALTDEKGHVVKRYDYSPFGTPIPNGIASPYLAPVKGKIHNYFPPSRRNTITYTGREYSKDSGLYYYRARYYDSMTGRFLQKDPLRSISPYIYVNNNPINRVDPFGLQSVNCCDLNEVKSSLNLAKDSLLRIADLADKTIPGSGIRAITTGIKAILTTKKVCEGAPGVAEACKKAAEDLKAKPNDPGAGLFACLKCCGAIANISPTPIPCGIICTRF